MVQEYTDDTAELRRLLDALGGMAALQQPELQLQAIMELEQAVSAVRGMVQFWGYWQLGLRLGGTCADDRPGLGSKHVLSRSTVAFILISALRSTLGFSLADATSVTWHRRCVRCLVLNARMNVVEAVAAKQRMCAGR